jgi:hypothetical protein
MHQKDFLMEHFEIIDHLARSLFNYFIMLLIGGGSHCKTSMTFHWCSCSSEVTKNWMIIAAHIEVARIAFKTSVAILSSEYLRSN